MEPIEVTLRPVSIYGLLIRDNSLHAKKKWLKKFFPDEVKEADKKGKITDSLLYDWKQQLYDLTDDAGLYILDKPGDSLDYYLGVIPFYPWDGLNMNKHKSKEAAFKAIVDFLEKYFELTKDELEALKNKIDYHNTIFTVTKGEEE